MNIKHFIKTLIIFVGMILLGLLGVYLVNHFDKDNTKEVVPNNANIAK
jgi:hypothetical protein